jgi:hypothetical protein
MRQLARIVRDQHGLITALRELHDIFTCSAQPREARVRDDLVDDICQVLPLSSMLERGRQVSGVYR